MLHTIIIAARASARVHQAEFCRVNSDTWRRKDTTEYVVTIYPPAARPFLPSDEVLATIMASVTGYSLDKSCRSEKGDSFMIKSGRKGIFGSRAGPGQRKIRKRLLQKVSEHSSAHPDVPAYVQSATESLMLDCKFKDVTWSGKEIIAHDYEGHEFDSHQVTKEPTRRLMRQCERACKHRPPFTIKVIL